MEETYEPDNDGEAISGNNDLKHYRIEYGPKMVNSFFNIFLLFNEWKFSSKERKKKKQNSPS